MNPLAVLNIVMLGILCVLTGTTVARNPGNLLLLAGYAAMGAVLFLYPKIKLRRIDFPKWFARIFPVLYVMVIFDSLVLTVSQVNPWRADDWLMKLDRLLLGVDATVWLEQGRLYPLLVELMAYVYMSYFFLPFVLIFLMWRSGKIEEITCWGCVVTITLYANYLFYYIVPGVGPRFHLTHVVPLEGAFVADWLISTLNEMESNKFNIFPSAHVSVSLVILYGFVRFYRRLVIPVALVVAGIAVATVYLRYHYVVDVFAGALLAGVGIVAGEKFFRWWRPLEKADMGGAACQTGQTSL